MGIFCVASAGIYLDRVVRVESLFLAHLTPQPLFPWSPLAEGWADNQCISIRTKHPQQETMRLFLRRIWMTSIIQSHSGEGEVWDYFGAINCAWLVIFNKTRWKNLFLFPSGNTSSRLVKSLCPFRAVNWTKPRHELEKGETSTGSISAACSWESSLSSLNSRAVPGRSVLAPPSAGEELEAQWEGVWEWESFLLLL